MTNAPCCSWCLDTISVRPCPFCGLVAVRALPVMTSRSNVLQMQDAIGKAGHGLSVSLVELRDYIRSNRA